MDSNSSWARSWQQNEGVLQISNRSLALLRQLRMGTMRLHKILFDSRPSPTEMSGTYFQQVHGVRNDLRDYFDNIENCARALPDHLPHTETINRLTNALEEEQVNVPNMVTMDTMFECGDWNEGNSEACTYLGELLRLQRPGSSSVVPRILSFSDWTTGMSPHAQFELAFAQFQKQLLKDKVGIFPTVLESTAVGSIFELKFGVLSESNIAYMLKMLVVENAGAMEHILLVAPHEDWSFYTDLEAKRVDVNKQAQYIVYRKLSEQANHLLVLMNNAKKIRWAAETLLQFCVAFGKIQNVFNTKCRRCKKVMKDFLPPVIFDLRDLDNSLHEGCR